MGSFGNSGLKKQPGAKYSVERNGLARYDVRYMGDPGGMSFHQGDESEDYPNVVLLSASITSNPQASGDCDEIAYDLHYEGKDDQFSNFDDSQDLSIDCNVTLEPIESHRLFASEIGGTPSAPLHGAKFDANGKFDFFAIEDPDHPGILNPYAGIRSYYMPQLTVSQSRIDMEWPDLSQLGQVVETAADFPELPPGVSKNYLYTGIRSRNIANVYYVNERVLQSSGPRGWIEPIYVGGSDPYSV